jgi:molecular chaperone GrpE
VRRGCTTTKHSGEASSASPNRSKYEALQKELGENEELIVKLTKENLYSAAACDNLRKEILEAKKTAELHAMESFARDMLDVCDAVKVVARIADQYLQENKSAPPRHVAAITGVKLTVDVAMKAVKRHGVSEICTTIGAPFDETQQEKLYTVPSTPELKNESVAEIVKDGYLLNGLILRKAQVAVSEDP